MLGDDLERHVDREAIGVVQQERVSAGDPLGIGEQDAVDERTAYEVTFDSDYPDALVQIARIIACERSGDVILSAAREWDLRARYEPIPHRSTHGALHREPQLRGGSLAFGIPEPVEPRQRLVARILRQIRLTLARLYAFSRAGSRGFSEHHKIAQGI